MSQKTTLHGNERTDKHRPQVAGDEQLTAGQAVLQCFHQYAKEHPEVVALWSFGIGFVLGWKIKPW